MQRLAALLLGDVLAGVMLTLGPVLTVRILFPEWYAVPAAVLQMTGQNAVFSSHSNSVTVDRRLDASTDWERAAVLARALHHVADYADGRLDGSAEACSSSEGGALITEAAEWAELWKDRVPIAQNSAQSDLNTLTLSLAQDPFGFTASTLSSSTHVCDG